MMFCRRGGSSRKVWTASMSPERRVSSPTALTSMITGPRASTRPASIESPFLTSTGTDSPVNGALSSAPCPSTITPSAGINSPLRISSRSPIRTSSIGTSSWFSSGSRSVLSSTAIKGSGAAIANENAPLARASLIFAPVEFFA